MARDTRSSALAITAREAMAKMQAQLDDLDARFAAGYLGEAEYQERTLLIVLELKETLRRPITDAIWQIQHPSAS